MGNLELPYSSTNTRARSSKRSYLFLWLPTLAVSNLPLLEQFMASGQLCSRTSPITCFEVPDAVPARTRRKRRPGMGLGYSFGGWLVVLARHVKELVSRTVWPGASRRPCSPGDFGMPFECDGYHRPGSFWRNGEEGVEGVEGVVYQMFRGRLAEHGNPMGRPISRCQREEP
jgi:hypothetical protein